MATGLKQTQYCDKLTILLENALCILHYTSVHRHMVDIGSIIHSLNVKNKQKNMINRVYDSGSKIVNRVLNCIQGIKHLHVKNGEY